MANTIREQIISAYATRLATITTVNGYNYNIGSNIYRAIKDVDKTPAAVIWPFADTNINQEYGSFTCTMPIKIEAINEFGTTNHSVVQEKLYADLLKCIFDTSVTISNKVENVVFTSGGNSDAANAEDTATGAYIEIEITYNIKIGDPYTQL